MKVRIIRQVEGGQPIGTEIEDPSGWILCELEPPVAEPIDDECKAKCEERKRHFQKIREKLLEASKAAAGLAEKEQAAEQQARRAEFERQLLE